MSEPKRVQIIRPNQNIDEFLYDRDEKSPEYSYEQYLLDKKEYYNIGWRRLKTIQKLSLSDNWPIIVGNAAIAATSGLLGGTITRCMARNLLLHLSVSTLPTIGACFLAVSVSHLSTYYYLVLRPMLSGDPMLCSTCLEIRSFTLASFIPLVMGTSIAVTSNLSSCLINRTIHLPQFKIQAYPEWAQFFRKHAFKGMSRRHFAAYPLISGFLASMVFLGQNYYWKNDLQYRLNSLEDELVHRTPRKSNGFLRPIDDFLAKYLGRRS